MAQFRADEEARLAKLMMHQTARLTKREEGQAIAVQALREEEDRQQQLLDAARRGREATAKVLAKQEEMLTQKQLALNVSPPCAPPLSFQSSLSTTAVLQNHP